MIAKENTNPIPIDRLEKAGYYAERKVAYYLKMAFDEKPDLLILNDLRIELEDGVTAQMDHLVIHQHGLIIIESKSVAGKLQVQDDGQWVRWYPQSKGKDNGIGMPNPIKQAKLQGQSLRKLLLKNASNESTRKAIDAFPTDVLVTFSNSNGGVFIAKDKSLYPEVCAADSVDDRVSKIVAERAEKAEAHDFSLSDVNRHKLADFLIKIHKPYTSTLAKPQYVQPHLVEKVPEIKQNVSTYIHNNKPKPTTVIGAIAETITNVFSEPECKFKNLCRKCKSDKLEVRFGKSYYLKCLSCEENNRIDATCPKCKKPLKIRKDKNRFFAECAACKTSELFHINN